MKVGVDTYPETPGYDRAVTLYLHDVFELGDYNAVIGTVTSHQDDLELEEQVPSRLYLL